MAQAHVEAPWHSLPGMNEGFPSYPSAPTKRTPIKGKTSNLIYLPAGASIGLKEFSALLLLQ